jgi:hypothetical protein
MSPSRGPQFPLYIPSKGRHEYLMTSKALTAMGVDHFLVVEPQQVDAYRTAVKALGIRATVLELDLSFKDAYEKCDDLGLTKSTGPGPARNFAWEHARAAGHDWHWVMDDNIRAFYRLNQNLRVKVVTPEFWTAQEDFVLRYSNVAMAGPNYFMFAPRKSKFPPFITNTRIYSCNLIRNDVGYRWRGRYNEDTILSLDLLKAGWCTVQFYAFLQDKLQTQQMKGGNTAEFYHAEGVVQAGSKYADTGTVAKSEMLARAHPDVARVTWRYGRVHHMVDYSQWKDRALIRRAGVEVPNKVNNYGMRLIQKEQ